MSKAKKALVLLTTFWDAEALIENKYFDFKVKNGLYRGNLFVDGEMNPSYRVLSIALSHPPLNKFSHIKKFDRLDFWCPTYDMLKDYHNDRDWAKYQLKYENLMKKRKGTVKAWIDSLLANKIYILCCWENTAKEAKCHRQLMYEALLSSNYAKQKLLPVYRDGNKLEKEITQIPNQNIVIEILENA